MTTVTESVLLDLKPNEALRVVLDRHWNFRLIPRNPYLQEGRIACVEIQYLEIVDHSSGLIGMKKDHVFKETVVFIIPASDRTLINPLLLDLRTSILDGVAYDVLRSLLRGTITDIRVESIG